MNKAIKKIELDLGGKIVSLTPQQAQNLKDALDDLFGKEIVKVIEKEFITIPQPYPVYRDIEPWRPRWYYDKVWCDSNTASYKYDSDTLRLTG